MYIPVWLLIVLCVGVAYALERRAFLPTGLMIPRGGRRCASGVVHNAA